MLRALLALLLLAGCATYTPIEIKYREAPSTLLPSGARPTAIDLLRLEEKRPKCVVAGAGSVVCYMPYTREMYQLQAVENAISPRLLISLPAADPLPLSGHVDTYLWDLSAHKDDADNLLISWTYDRNSVQSINLLRVKPGGEVKHHLVKEFKPYDPIFTLRMFVVEPDFVQFFYTNYSEKYFSPISDTGSIEKLWTLGWREGRVVFDTQLSETGHVHTTQYDVSAMKHGQFDVVWTERRIGSFFGPRPKFKVGSVIHDGEKPRLRTSAEISIDKWDAKDRLIFPVAVSNGKDGIKAIAAIYGGKKGTVFMKVDAGGKMSGEVPIEGDEVSDLVYDAQTGLFRYVKGRLQGFLGPPAAIRAEVHWTDFRGSEWVEKLEARTGSIFPVQGAGDCFYWLQPERKTFLLLKKCRGSARSRMDGRQAAQGEG